MVTSAANKESNELWVPELKLRMRVGGMTCIEEGSVVKMGNDKMGFVHLASKATRLLCSSWSWLCSSGWML